MQTYCYVFFKMEFQPSDEAVNKEAAMKQATESALQETDPGTQS